MLSRSLLIASLAAVPAAALTELGPFQLDPVVTCYLVVAETPCQLTATVTQGGRSNPDRVLLRVLDPDEQELAWRYVEYVPDEEVNHTLAEHGIETRSLADRPATGAQLCEVTVELPAGGVYQVRAVGGDRNSQLTLRLSRELPWGISFQNGYASRWREAPTRFHLYIPPHAAELTVKDGPVTVRNAAGAAVIEQDRGTATVSTAYATGEIWSVEVPETNWKFASAGLPVILCDSPASAAAIAGSVEVLPDGTLVSHRFQARIQALRPSLLAPERVGRTADLIDDFAAVKPLWLADPLRYQHVTESYLTTVNGWLESQNLDPACPWAGAMGGWREWLAKPGLESRWDRLGVIPGIRAGVHGEANRDAAIHLAMAVAHDDPGNPWRGRRELAWRAAAAALLDLMRLGEDETWPGVSDLDPYPGNMAFTVAQQTFPVYGLAAPFLPAEVTEVWTEGLRRLVDRYYADGLVSCRNQSSHYLVANEHFANGSGLPRYRALADLYSRRFARGSHACGWHEERTGPDASYIGMTHWHMAEAWRLGENPTLLESIRRSYEFFNHTVAPEPGGRMLGGFNFNHRIAEGFYFEQYSGAKGLLDDILPDVGAWRSAPTATAQADAEAEARARIERWLADPKPARYPTLSTPRLLYYTDQPVAGTLPAQRDESFVANLGGELVAVRRPRYYTYLYVGKPAAGEFYISDRDKFRAVFPDDAESSGGTYRGGRSATPFLGGGMSGFWTPEYGHAILATNWSPVCQHGLVATTTDGLRYWADYFATEFELDEAAGTLVVTGRIEGLPLTYRREYTFGDEAVTVAVTVTASETVALDGFAEILPTPVWEYKAAGANLVAGGQTAGTVTADRARIEDDRGVGVSVVLDGPREIRLVPEGLKTDGWRKLQVGRLEIGLPTRLSVGESVTLTYELRPE